MSVQRLAGVAIAGVLLSACQSAPPSISDGTSERAPPAELRLIDARPLVLADDCAASGSYQVEFEVLADGRTAAIKPPAAPACVQRALTAWVGSFRYVPPSGFAAATSATGSGSAARPRGARESGSGIPATIEWMLVTARKGS